MDAEDPAAGESGPDGDDAGPPFDDEPQRQRQRRRRQRQRQLQQTQQQHRHVSQLLLSQPHASSPPTHSPSPGHTVEKLARKLSRHNLRLDRPSNHSQLPPPQPTQLPLSPSAPLPDLGEFPSYRSWAGPEPRERPCYGGLIAPWLAAVVQVEDEGEPIEVDEAYLQPPDEDRLDAELEPLRRPASSARLRGGGGPNSNARPVDPRLAAMIASGTQCNVRNEPPPPTTCPPSQPSAPPWPPPTEPPPPIEPYPDCDTPTPDPEVADAAGDDAECLEAAAAGDAADPDAETADIISLRHATGPGGIRKCTVGGVLLRYRLSADAALRCANVVRSRPRMRRRDKKSRYAGGGWSAASSSVATSVVASPVMQPAALAPAPAPTSHPLSYPPPP